MNQFLIVFKREYFARIKNKWFWITTLILPILIVAVYLVPLILISFGEKVETNLLMINSEKFLSEEDLKIDSELIKFEVSNLNLDSAKEKVKNEDKKIDAIVDFDNIKPEENFYDIPVLTKETLSLTQETDIRLYLQDILNSLKLRVENIPPEKAEKLNQTINPVFEPIDEKSSTAYQAFTLAYIAGFIMYFVLIYYGSIIMQTMQEEKKNRIVEILLTAIRPINLLVGKLLGVTAIGITQILLWVSILIVLIPLGTFMFMPSQDQIDDLVSQDQMNMSQIQTITDSFNLVQFLPLFFIYLFLGFLLYAGIFAMVGVSVDNEVDMQSFASIGMIPIIIGFLLSLGVVDNPNSTISLVSSFFPLTSPLTMIARIPFGVPIWQIILSIVILFLTAIFMIWMASKIYKIGILLYGEKLSWKHIKVILNKN